MRRAAARGPFIDINEFKGVLRTPQLAEAKGQDPFEELERMLYPDEAGAAADPYNEGFLEESARQPSVAPAAAIIQAAEAPGLDSDPIDLELQDLFDEAIAAWAVRDRAGVDSRDQDQDAGCPLDGSQAYLDFSMQDGEKELSTQSGADGKRRFLRVRSWYAAAGIAAMGVAGAGWAYAHRSEGSVTLRSIAQMVAPTAPERMARPEQGAGTPNDNQGAPAQKSVTREEPPVVSAVTEGDSAVDVNPVDAQRQAGDAYTLTTRKVKAVQVKPGGGVFDSNSAPGDQAPSSRGAALLANDAASSGSTAIVASENRSSTTPALPAQPARRRAEKLVSEAEDDASTDGAASGGRGPLEVRLGSAGTEAEARRLMEKIAGEFGSQLGGHTLGYRHAKVQGKRIYFVRLRSKLRREAAVGLCEKITSAGGNCTTGSK